MADDKKAAPEQAESSGGKSKLLLLLVVLNVLGMAGAGVAIFFALTQSGTAAAAEAAAPEPNEIGPLIEVPTLIVNMTDNNGTHFMRAGFNLELRNAEQQADIEARMVPIRSAILLHLSGLAVADTTGREQRQALLESLTALVNEVVGGDSVRRMYFTEFVVQ